MTNKTLNQNQGDTQALDALIAHMTNEAKGKSKSKKAEEKEMQLKKNPSVYMMVISMRIFFSVLMLSLCFVPIGGITWLWYETAPYRAAQSSKASAIVVIEQAKAKEEAKIEAGKLLSEK